jgi:hypothetical protein
MRIDRGRAGCSNPDIKSIRHTGALALLAALLSLPGTTWAQSRTLGSPLAQAPNLGFGCESKPTFTAQSFNGDYFLLPSNQADCTWFQSGVIGSVDYSDPRTGSVPADGLITNVAVRGGVNPAAFRIVIVRQIGGLAGGGVPTTACCAFVSETPPAGSPPFRPTPSPTGVTNFPVNIPVERNIRGTSAVADYVGISGVSGTGELPLLDTGDNNVLTGYRSGSPDAGFLYPRMGALEAPGGGTRNNESIPNVEVLVQWTWTPAGGVPTPPTPLPPVAPAPTPTPTGPAAPVAGNAAQVAAGRALIQLACGGNAACQGQLELLSRGAAKTAAKPTVYGTTPYSVAAAANAVVKVKLNSKGKALLRKRRSVKVGLRLTPTGGVPITGVVKLKR